MIHLEVIMVVEMVILLVKVVLLAALFGYLILSFVETHKTEPDKSDGIVKDESGDIISIDDIPFDEYMESL